MNEREGEEMRDILENWVRGCRGQFPFLKLPLGALGRACLKEDNKDTG